MAVIRGWWLVLPAHARGVGWIDVAAVLAFGGISIGLMLRGPVSDLADAPMPEPILPPARYEHDRRQLRAGADSLPAILAGLLLSVLAGVLDLSRAAVDRRLPSRCRTIRRRACSPTRSGHAEIPRARNWPG